MTVFYYLNRWFGVTAPITQAAVPNDVFEMSTAYVFENGVFGFENKNNKAFLASNTVRHSKYPKLAMLLVAVKKVFPNYESLVASEQYAFLIRRPYLVPIAWVYRLYRGVANKRINEGKKILKDSFVSKEYIAKREEMFRNWGVE